MAEREDIALELATLLYEHGFIVDSKKAEHHEADLQDVAALLRPHVWEWIPVAKSIPAEKGRFLVMVGGHRYIAEWWQVLNGEFRWWADKSCHDISQNVTHWAALPSAPLSLESSNQK